MIYILISFQRRTQNAEYKVIGEYESSARAKLGMFDTIHRERDGYPFVHQAEFNQNSIDGFFITESENGIYDRDLVNFVSNNPGTFYEYL